MGEKSPPVMSLSGKVALWEMEATGFELKSRHL